MIFSLIRLSVHYGIEASSTKSEPGIRPVTSVLWNSFTVQIFNLCFYGMLFLLAESGLIEKFSHYLKNIFILRQKKYKSNINVDNDISQLISKTSSDLSENKPVEGLSMGLIINNNEEENINLDLESNNKENNVSSQKSKLYIEPLINEYVINESNRIKDQIGFLTKIEALKKIFWFFCKKQIVAVNNLYLGLELNEKFGLLGYNGSGKTVTFKMIINELLYFRS